MFESCDSVYLRTDIAKYFVGRSISKLIKKSSGFDVSVKLNKLEFTENSQTVTLKTDINVVMPRAEFERLLLALDEIPIKTKELEERVT